MAHYDLKSFIIWAVISAVIFMIVYSIWFNPGSVSYFFEKIKSSVKIGIQSATEQDSSVASCLSEINRKLEVTKEKSLIKINIYVKEYKKFNNNQNALDYLEYWEFTTNDLIGKNLIPFNFGMGGMGDWFNVKQNDIVIGLIRQQTSIGGQTISQLSPFLCINGEWKTEKRCPKGVMSGIKLIKNIPSSRVFNPADYSSFSYEVYSEEGDLDNYSLVLKDNSGKVLESDSGNNPDGDKVEISLEGKDLSGGIETIFTFTTSCGTYKE